MHELCPIDLEEFTVSIESGTNLAELKERIYRALDVIRVYTKLPHKKEPDMDKPYTMKRGGTLLDVAELVHKDVAENLKHARIWGSNIILRARSKGTMC